MAISRPDTYVLRIAAQSMNAGFRTGDYSFPGLHADATSGLSVVVRRPHSTGPS